MEEIKVENNIILVKLKNENKVRICLFNNKKPFYVNDCLTGEEFSTIIDTEYNCSITYLDCLRKFFGKQLDKEGIQELEKLVQTKEIRKQFVKTCKDLDKTAKKISDIIDKEERDFYGLDIK